MAKNQVAERMEIAAGLESCRSYVTVHASNDLELAIIEASFFPD